MDDELRQRAIAWIAGDPDPEMRAALETLLADEDEAALRAAIDGVLEFGTAGIRGVVGPGPLRMNRAVVIRTTRGLADFLDRDDPNHAKRGVVVGFDGRRDSAAFADDTVAVLAAAGFVVHFFPTPQPTPLVAYAQRVLGAAAAVVITASHNPPEYNGYKVYFTGAAQIVPPVDAAIASAIEAVGPAKDVPYADTANDEHVRRLGGDVLDRYLAELAAARPVVEGPDRRIVYTPLHGVGGPLVTRALAAGGYSSVHVVAEQAEPDGEFPTVDFPNPEEPGAMDAALELAREVSADLVLANDPDADRIAAAVPDGRGYRLLTGNEIGVLLADHLLRHADADRPLVVASIVSTPMLASIAEHYGARAEFTLTGFKWICAAARELERAEGYRFVYGFEEALGSSVGTVVRDKDGIGAAVAFADLARQLAGDGHQVLDRLDELALTHGLWVSDQLAITRPGVQGRKEIDDAMAVLERTTPTELAGHPVESVTDYRVDADARPAWLGEHDLVELQLTDGRAMIRPSGTEPKCKIYVDLRTSIGALDEIHDAHRELRDETREVARALAQFVGFETNDMA
ncbi:MAG: phospho-sugar mutase [Nitriliruptoraceae bacterium]